MNGFSSNELNKFKLVVNLRGYVKSSTNLHENYVDNTNKKSIEKFENNNDHKNSPEFDKNKSEKPMITQNSDPFSSFNNFIKEVNSSLSISSPTDHTSIVKLNDDYKEEVQQHKEITNSLSNTEYLMKQSNLMNESINMLKSNSNENTHKNVSSKDVKNSLTKKETCIRHLFSRTSVFENTCKSLPILEADDSLKVSDNDFPNSLFVSDYPANLPISNEEYLRFEENPNFNLINLPRSSDQDHSNSCIEIIPEKEKENEQETKQNLSDKTIKASHDEANMKQKAKSSSKTNINIINESITKVNQVNDLKLDENLSNNLKKKKRSNSIASTLNILNQESKLNLADDIKVKTLVDKNSLQTVKKINSQLSIDNKNNENITNQFEEQAIQKILEKEKNLERLVSLSSFSKLPLGNSQMNLIKSCDDNLSKDDRKSIIIAKGKNNNVSTKRNLKSKSQSKKNKGKKSATGIKISFLDSTDTNSHLTSPINSYQELLNLRENISKTKQDLDKVLESKSNSNMNSLLSPRNSTSSFWSSTFDDISEPQYNEYLHLREIISKSKQNSGKSLASKSNSTINALLSNQNSAASLKQTSLDIISERNNAYLREVPFKTKIHMEKIFESKSFLSVNSLLMSKNSTTSFKKSSEDISQVEKKENYYYKNKNMVTLEFGNKECDRRFLPSSVFSSRILSELYFTPPYNFSYFDLPLPFLNYNKDFARLEEYKSLIEGIKINKKLKNSMLSNFDNIRAKEIIEKVFLDLKKFKDNKQTKNIKMKANYGYHLKNHIDCLLKNIEKYDKDFVYGKFYQENLNQHFLNLGKSKLPFL